MRSISKSAVRFIVISLVIFSRGLLASDMMVDVDNQKKPGDIFLDLKSDFVVPAIVSESKRIKTHIGNPIDKPSLRSNHKPKTVKLPVPKRMLKRLSGKSEGVTGFIMGIPELKSAHKVKRSIHWKRLENNAASMKLQVISPKAKGLRLGLEILSIPDEAELRFFSSSDNVSQVISGSEINIDLSGRQKQHGLNSYSKIFWSPIMKGEVIGLEIYLPPGVAARRLNISVPKLNHLLVSADKNESQDNKLMLVTPKVTTPENQYCGQAVACDQKWNTSRNSVVLIRFSDDLYSYSCTGTLINDASGSGTPYVLTSKACLLKNRPSNEFDLSALETEWFYYEPFCGSGNGQGGLNDAHKRLTGGADILFESGDDKTINTDAALLVLRKSPPIGVTFSGWTSLPQQIDSLAASLHNPSSLLYFQFLSKAKVAEFLDCTSPDYINNYGRYDCSTASTGAQDGNFYKMDWLDGNYAGTLGGSGIFTEDGQYIFGQLMGAEYSSCSSGVSHYGRFDKSYNQGLGYWLTADHNKKVYRLEVSKNGGGNVQSTPAGINCGVGCVEQAGNFAPSSKVVLSASSSTDWQFKDWSGDCLGDGLCNLDMNSQKKVIANFRPSILVKIYGSGRVTSNPPGVDCITDQQTGCGSFFSLGESVTLTAVANTGYQFDKWESGPCASSTIPYCVVSMDRAHDIAASFVRAPILLSVQVSGNGIVKSLPEGIECGIKSTEAEKTICSAYFVYGSQVNLVPSADIKWEFGGWGGACAGSDPCEVDIDAEKIVQVNFVRSKYNLSVIRSGSGAVTVSEPITSCGSSCYTYLSDTAVNMVASAASGWRFVGWGGDAISCGLNLSCNIIMSQGKTVLANYETISTSNKTLYVTKSEVGGSGVVSSNPSGVNCGNVCGWSYEINSTVTLRATPNPGSIFGYWTGACAGSSQECTVTISDNKTVKAQFFAAQSQHLNVDVRKSGVGSVFFNPPGFDCDSSAGCSTNLLLGTYLTLRASPADGWNFVGWSGDCSGLDDCVVIVDSNKSILALFEKINKDEQLPLIVSADSAEIYEGESTVNLYARGGTTLGAVTYFASGSPGLTCSVNGNKLTAIGNGGICSVWATREGDHQYLSVTSDPIDINVILPQRELSVSKSGNGQVYSSPSAISCGTVCSVYLNKYSNVTLRAEADSGYYFVGWSGACSGLNDCQLTMTENRSVTAVFEPIPTTGFTLSVTRTRNGTVTSLSPNTGIDCGTTCQANFSAGKWVTLFAQADKGHTFMGWAGAAAGLCGRNTSCDVYMASNQSISADFKNTYTLIMPAINLLLMD